METYKNKVTGAVSFQLQKSDEAFGFLLRCYLIVARTLQTFHASLCVRSGSRSWAQRSSASSGDEAWSSPSRVNRAVLLRVPRGTERPGSHKYDQFLPEAPNGLQFMWADLREAKRRQSQAI